MSAPALTLALDTSTTRGSVAVWDGESVLFHEEFSADRSHSSALFTVLERARALGRFDLIAVGLGPGSYSGVRIAIAAAMGLAMAGGARLVGLPSAALLRDGKYAVIGDARRGTFYWSVVDDGLCLEGPELLEEAGLRERLDRADLPVFASETVPGFAAELAFPSAVRLAFPSAVRLAIHAARGRGIVAEGDLEPIYLREPHITPPKPR